MWTFYLHQSVHSGFSIQYKIKKTNKNYAYTYKLPFQVLYALIHILSVIKLLPFSIIQSPKINTRTHEKDKKKKEKKKGKFPMAMPLGGLAEVWWLRLLPSTNHISHQILEPFTCTKKHVCNRVWDIVFCSRATTIRFLQSWLDTVQTQIHIYMYNQNSINYGCLIHIRITVIWSTSLSSTMTFNMPCLNRHFPNPRLNPKQIIYPNTSLKP